MKYKSGSKVVLNSDRVILYITPRKEPTDNKIEADILLCNKFDWPDIFSMYKHGLYFDVVKTYKVGDMLYSVLDTEDQSIFVLVDEDSLEPWKFTEEDKNLLRRKTALLAKNPKFELKPIANEYDFPMILQVSEINE